jgi:hypothetical protein
MIPIDSGGAGGEYYEGRKNRRCSDVHI